ncbi:hypothetical protein DID78_04435 [Candidatus Marinamargulisbacteria bacterium SCGC AG-343-D04]|nr:hypothetical protein DID78_04435 [Candidatus Marinamargulisbacteria bacterium SCGC AG-343-D04]
MKLTVSQKAALDYSQNILVEAGAGSGKTTLFVTRYCQILEENVDISPQQVLALTFTNKAAGECLSRIYKHFSDNESIDGRIHDIWRQLHHAHITTIHGFCATLCREFAFECGISPQFSIVSDSDRLFLIQLAFKAFMIEVPEYLEEDLTQYLRQFSESRLERDILQCFNKEDILSGFSSVTEQTMTDLSRCTYRIYLELKKRVERLKLNSNSLDYHDLIVCAKKLLEQKEIRNEVQERFAYIMVDECQDTDPLQWDIMSLLCHSEHPLHARKLFMVGDVKQCIYRFRGADLSFFKQLTTDFTSYSQTSSIVHLSENFRSSENVLSVINPVFSYLFEHHSIHKTQYTPLQAQLDISGRVEALFLKDSTEMLDELDMISRRCSQAYLDQDLSFKDMLILTRERRYGEKIKDYLVDKGFPVILDKQKGFFQQQVVLDMFNCIKGLCHLSDDVSWFSVLQSPFFGASLDLSFCIINAPGNSIVDKCTQYLSSKDINPDYISSVRSIKEMVSEWVCWSKTQRFSTLMSRLMKQGSFQAYLQEKHERVTQADRVLDLLLECESSPRYSRYTLLEELEFKCSIYDTPFESDQPEDNSIRISTIHSAKGLEYPLVIVAGCHRKFPLKTSDTCLIHTMGMHVSDGSDSGKEQRNAFFGKETELSIEEEKRLFYVACTRAKRYLVLSGLVHSMHQRSYMNFLYQLPEFRVDAHALCFEDEDQQMVSIDLIQQIHGLPDRDIETRTSSARSITSSLSFPDPFSIENPTSISSLEKESRSSYESESMQTLYYAHAGTLIHEGIMRSLHVQDPSFTVLSFLKNHPLYKLLPESLQKKCRESIEHSMGHDLFQSLDTAALRHEYPVTGEWEGVSVSGRIDILEKTGETLHIVDIKTDSLSSIDRLFDRYHKQLNGYAQCLKRLFPAYNDIRCTLFSTELIEGISWTGERRTL